MAPIDRRPSAKGITVIPPVAVLRSDVARAKQLLRPELHHYLEESLAVSQWYPEEDLQEIILALGELLRDRVPTDNIWEFIGRQGALRVLSRQGNEEIDDSVKKGMYADALVPGEHMRNLRQASTLWSLYHTTGKLSYKVIDAQRLCILLKGFTLGTAEYCQVQTGYFRQAVAIGGGTDVDEVEVTHTECVHRGDDQCAWDVRVDRPSFVQEDVISTDAFEAKQRMMAAVRHLEPKGGPKRR